MNAAFSKKMMIYVLKYPDAQCTLPVLFSMQYFKKITKYQKKQLDRSNNKNKTKSSKQEQQQQQQQQCFQLLLLLRSSQQLALQQLALVAREASSTYLTCRQQTTYICAIQVTEAVAVHVAFSRTVVSRLQQGLQIIATLRMRLPWLLASGCFHGACQERWICSCCIW